MVGETPALSPPLNVKYLNFYRTRVRSLGMLVSDSLPNSLTHSYLVNLIDVNLACEDDNSKLVEVVNVPHVDDEKRVDNSLLQIWKLKFGHKAKVFVQTLSTRFQGLVKILKLMFRQDFEAKVWSLFCC